MTRNVKKEQHLFDIKISCYKDIINVFTVVFDPVFDNVSFPEEKKRIQLFH